MSDKARRLVLPALLSLPVVAWAATAKPPHHHAFTARIGFGYASSTGTSSSRNLNTRDSVRYLRHLWRYSGRLNYNYATDAAVVSEDRLTINLKAERYFSSQKENFGLLALRYDRNPFDGYRRYQVESIGIGHRLVNRTDLHVDVEGGFGFRQNYFLTGGSANVPALRAGLDVSWHMSSKSLLSERVETVATTQGTLFTSETGLSAPIDRGLALKISENVDHYTSPPLGFAPTSTFTTVDLIYNLV